MATKPSHEYQDHLGNVRPGDTVRAEVYAKYLDTNSSNWTTALNNLITSIANGTAPAGTFVDGGAVGSTGGTTPSFIGLLNKGSESGTAPKAYLNYLIFDRNYVLLNGGFVRMSEAAREYGQGGAHEKLAAEIAITEPGYVYLYLSNDNAALGGAQVEVYFDDFKVTHTKSPVVQSDDYYPFGLTFNSYSRENSTKNRFLFQGQEHIDDLDLGWDSFKWRNHQPEIGRFFNVDPLAESYYYNSPYAFSENRVVDGVELEGLEWKSIKDDKSKTSVNIIQAKVKNISSMSASESMAAAFDIATQAEKSLSGPDSDGVKHITKVSLDFESEVGEGDFFIELRDNIERKDGTVSKHVSGIVDEIGDTQSNRIQVNVDKDRPDMIRTGAHEIGHTGGLEHPERDGKRPGKDSKGNNLDKNNLMIQGGDGTKVTPGQLKVIKNEIKNDTEDKRNKN